MVPATVVMPTPFISTMGSTVRRMGCSPPWRCRNPPAWLCWGRPSLCLACDASGGAGAHKRVTADPISARIAGHYTKVAYSVTPRACGCFHIGRSADRCAEKTWADRPLPGHHLHSKPGRRRKSAPQARLVHGFEL